MKSRSCSCYTGTMIGLLTAIHVAAIYYEIQGANGDGATKQGQSCAITHSSPSPAPSAGVDELGSDLDSVGWFLLGALSIANLALKPRGNGFWTRHNVSMLIPLILIIAVGTGLGMLRQFKELLDWQKTLCLAVEICALVTQDVLFLIHLFTVPDADAESAKTDHVEQATP